MRLGIFISFSFFCIQANAGHVEPCSRWESIPVKICKGDEALFSKYKLSLQEDHKSVKTLSKYFLKSFSDTKVITSNQHYPQQDKLWKLAKEVISNEFTKSKTGIYFEFIESKSLDNCDSVLFFADGLTDGYEGISSIGNRPNKRMVTNKMQYTPSFTLVNASSTIDTSNFENLTEDEKRERFDMSFKNTLVHEIGHLAGLRHSHNYKKEYNKYFDTKLGARESRTAKDVCGMDPYSIMSYHFIDWMEGVNNLITEPPVQRQGKSFEECRLSENDMKSLRCLYGVEPDCSLKCNRK
jgi:hypothetical protein